MTDTPTNGKPRGRKPKLSQARIDVAEKVLSDDNQFLARTEKEVFDEINSKLDPAQQISYSIYQDYKGWRIPANPEYKNLFADFSHIIRKAERRTKTNLIKWVASWQAWRQWQARVASRRFKEARGEKKEIDVNMNGWVVYLPMVEWEIIEPEALENTEETSQ